MPGSFTGVICFNPHSNVVKGAQVLEIRFVQIRVILGLQCFSSYIARDLRARAVAYRLQWGWGGEAVGGDCGELESVPQKSFKVN